MTTNECWLAMHDTCSMPEHCECPCHATVDELLEELGAFLTDETASDG